MHLGRTAGPERISASTDTPERWNQQGVDALDSQKSSAAIRFQLINDEYRARRG